MSDNIYKYKFTKYINTIIKNTSINYFKKQKYIKQKELELIELDNVSSSYKDDGTIFLCENTVSHKKLEDLFSNEEHYKAMKSLTDRQKLVLYLTILEKLSFESIAEILNIDVVTVRTTLYKAKKAFNKNLNEGK